MAGQENLHDQEGVLAHKELFPDVHERARSTPSAAKRAMASPIRSSDSTLDRVI